MKELMLSNAERLADLSSHLRQITKSDEVEPQALVSLPAYEVEAIYRLMQDSKTILKGAAMKWKI